MKNFRGEELYIYPPDTFLKPILILSKTGEEFAIMFQEGLNHFTLLREGLKSAFIIIERGSNKKFNEWKRKLQNAKDNGWEFYNEIYEKYYTKKKERKNEN